MGNLCGMSTGEALSRWCSMLVSNNALADFASAPQWIADGMANWVDSVEPTDQDYDSIGCGMAFLSWMQSKGHTLASLAQEMVKNGDAGTLAQLYGPNAWTDFQNAMTALPGGPQSVTSDDPFNAMGTPQPQPNPQPAPNPQPQPQPQPGPGVDGVTWACLAADALIAGVAAGETAAQLKADVDAIPT